MVIHFHFKMYFFHSFYLLFILSIYQRWSLKYLKIVCSLPSNSLFYLLNDVKQLNVINSQKPQEIVRIPTPKGVNKPQTIILFRMKMIFIVISHFPLISEQCFGKPSVYSQFFEKLCTSCAQILICFINPFCQKFLKWNPSSRQTNIPRISPLTFREFIFTRASI